MSTWLVTGGSGFVGQALRRRLAELGAVELDQASQGCNEVHDKTEDRSPAEPTQVLYAKRGEALNHLSAAKHSRSIAAVIHLAGVAHVGRAQAAEARAVNLDASLALLNAAIDAGVGRFVYLSSSLAAAAEQGVGDVTDYGRDKLAVEQALLAAAAAGKIEVVILRSVNIYGPGMRGNLAAMIRLMQAGLLPRLPKLSNKLSLVGVADVAHALVAAATCALDNGAVRDRTDAVPEDFENRRRGRAALRVTLTDGVDYSLNELQDAIFAAFERHPSRLRLPRMLLFAAACCAELGAYLRLSRSGISRRTYYQLTRDNLFDNSDAQRAIGFTPTTSCFEALPSIVAAMSEKKMQE